MRFASSRIPKKLIEQSNGESAYDYFLEKIIDGGLYLLDEPENSLSVVWQKNIINDILQNSNNSSITVATQSPYIVSDDNLEESVIYLPIENENE